MAFKTVIHGVKRDETYASQIAAERPIGFGRIHCELDAEDADPNNCLMGGEHSEHDSEAVSKFNRELRGK